jgi:hypothetical protein
LAALGIAHSTAVAPTAYAAQVQQPNQQNEECARIEGIVRDSAQLPLANTTVRLRNVTNGLVESRHIVTSDSSGAFVFTDVDAGTYVIEIVDSAGNLIGTSPTLQVNDRCDPITGLIINTTAVGPAAAGAAAGAAFFATTSGIIVLAAGGLAAVVIAKDLASPSR